MGESRWIEAENKIVKAARRRFNTKVVERHGSTRDDVPSSVES
jgi:hypothetical protein